MSTPENQMEYIWDRIPKQKDGKTIKYIKGDIDYLYLHGFVDTQIYKLEEWKQAFAPYRQADESYVLNKEQFLALRMYRYTGPSHELFDAYKIEEGAWSDKDLQILFDRSIGVASSVTKEFFWAAIDGLKKTGHYTDKDGKFIMNQAAKMGIHDLVILYPSPRTRLEREVKRIREEKDKKLAANQKNRDASGFSVGQSEIENKANNFKKMQNTSSKTVQASKKVEAKESIDIKKLKKPAPKFRG